MESTRPTGRSLSTEDRERGAVLILSALIMVLILMIAAFATDLGAWYRQGQQQQRAADLGSLNGINAYDRELKAYFTSQGASSWGDLNAAQQATAEQQAMQAAYDAVVAVLEGAGTTVSASPVMAISPPPGESTATVTADDGTLIVITRTVDNEIIMSVTQPGTQYFSSVVRGAPDITRTATAVVSNCSATCNIPIVLNPPFAGFSEAGKGDGFGPLVYGNEIWAVNHHVRSTSEGEIVCMNRITETFCSPTGQFSLGDYNTGNRPVEHIDTTRGKIYFTVRDDSSDKSGLACFSVAARGYCSTPFRALWDQSSHSWPQVVNASGPWASGNKLYVINQEGTLACVDADTMATCGSWNTAAFGHPAMPALSDSAHIINGEKSGSKIYFTHYVSSGVVFHCWDLATNAVCANWTAAKLAASVAGDDDSRLTFFKYDSSTHQPNGICVVSLLADPAAALATAVACYDLSGNGPTTIPGMSTHLSNLAQTWAGDSYSWQGRRTFFAGGNSNNSACWNWEVSPSGAACGILDHFSQQVDPTYPYAFAELTSECIIGLGHESRFFSFNPVGLTNCVDTSTTTTINPCQCTQGSGNRWGLLEVPSDLLNDVDAIEATVTAPDGTVLFNQLDLMASGGQLDLSGVDPSYAYLTLVLEVQSKLDVNGDPQWSNPYTADLAVVVQPTLKG